MIGGGHYIAVGAGAAADLITVRGYNALSNADLILYDRLADEKLLSQVSSKTMFVGKLPYKHGIRQTEINKLLREGLEANKTIVRLKGGDSAIFSRVMEEIAIAREVGASVEIIPGVTTASATMARLECSLTDRAYTSGVIYISGHRQGGADTGMPEYDWESIVANRFTLVVYMGARHIVAIVDKLMEHGLSGGTPILIASDVGQIDEQFSLCSLAEMKDFRYNTGSATLFVIGDVVKSAILPKDFPDAVNNA